MKKLLMVLFCVSLAPMVQADVCADPDALAKAEESKLAFEGVLAKEGEVSATVEVGHCDVWYYENPIDWTEYDYEDDALPRPDGYIATCGINVIPEDTESRVLLQDMIMPSNQLPSFSDDDEQYAICIRPVQAPVDLVNGGNGLGHQYPCNMRGVRPTCPNGERAVCGQAGYLVCPTGPRQPIDEPTTPFQDRQPIEEPSTPYQDRQPIDEPSQPAPGAPPID